MSWEKQWKCQRNLRRGKDERRWVWEVSFWEVHFVQTIDVHVSKWCLNKASVSDGDITGELCQPCFVRAVWDDTVFPEYIRVFIPRRQEVGSGSEDEETELPLCIYHLLLRVWHCSPCGCHMVAVLTVRCLIIKSRSSGEQLTHQSASCITGSLFARSWKYFKNPETSPCCL